MHILLFILYSVAGGYAIVRLPFFRNSGLRPGVLLLLFTLHVLTGCLHNIIAWRFYPGHGDIWTYYESSITTKDELFNHFHAFLRDNSTWNYFTHNSLTNIHLILNFFSRESLYINTLLFSFPVFLGTTALFRVFRRHFPGSMLTALSVYLLPSALFWTSCVHREGALYMFLGFFFYYMDRLSTSPTPAQSTSPTPVPSTSPAPAPYASPVPTPSASPTAAQSASSAPAPSASHTPAPSASPVPALPPARPRFWVSAALFFLLITYFRSAVALSLIPALAAGWWFSLPSRSLRKKSLLSGAIGLLIILVLAGPLLLKGLANEQQSFQVLEGNSRIELPVLDGSWGSLLHTLPAALLNGWLEPLPGAGGQKIYTAFSIELLLIWAIVVLAALTGLRRATASSPAADSRPAAASPAIAPGPTARPTPTARPMHGHFSVCCIVFALAGMLAVGLIVPFVGAIVRYRSIYLPFLLAPPLYRLCTTTFLRRIDQWAAHRL